jgi:HAD superfamily hydrolase (TIGR01484 family)
MMIGWPRWHFSSQRLIPHVFSRALKIIDIDTKLSRLSQSRFLLSAAMHYVALATDYDGTIAHDGEVDEPTIAALRRLRGASRRLILVTGREIDDLLRAMPELDLFDIVVAENGGLLYWPATKQERLLAAPPPPEFVARLQELKVSPLSVGRVIVASWEPNESTVLATIRELGLELQIIFNKGAVMVLPAGINKESGLKAALVELEISARNVVAVGDAENDFAFLDLCGMPVAVANALPRLKETAALVTHGERGAGVVELVDQWLADDLAEVDSHNPRQQVPLAAALDPQTSGLALTPVRESLLLTGTSGSGKSTLTGGLLERLAERGYQFVVLDPEGDYSDLSDAISIGLPEVAPRVEDILQVLHKTDASVVVNLLGVAPEDRPGYFAGLLPELLALRERTGRPHFVVVDEAHHMLPATWDPGATALPRGLKGFLFITVKPESLSARTLDCVDRAIAVGDSASEALAAFAHVHGISQPNEPRQVERGQALSLSRTDPVVRRWTIIPCTVERRRHARKYAEGKLGDDKSFYFRGPDAKLNLRATNLIMFLEMADGVDKPTWEWHRLRGDYSRWAESCIKDAELAKELREIEIAGTATNAAIKAVREVIERRYTLPT